MYVAPLILALLSMTVHVCCRFLLLGLLFLVVLCISIDSMAFVRLNASFWRCFLLQCGARVPFCVCSACILRLLASSSSLFRFFSALVSYLGFCLAGCSFVRHLDAFLAAFCVCVCAHCYALFEAFLCFFSISLQFLVVF